MAGSKVASKSKFLCLLIKAYKAESVFDDKGDFLDIVYWLRQIIAIIVGVIWGFIPFTGFFAIVMFFASNILFVYAYASIFQRVDEDEYGGYGEIIKEGLMTAFACFMVSWIVAYDYNNGANIH